jgi:hypothetical protein
MEVLYQLSYVGLTLASYRRKSLMASGRHPSNRVERALELLRETDRPVTEICP